jgi:hypothetical protein
MWTALQGNKQGENSSDDPRVIPATEQVKTLSPFTTDEEIQGREILFDHFLPFQPPSRSLQIIFYDPATKIQARRSASHTEKVCCHEARVFPEPPAYPPAKSNAQNDQDFFHFTISFI